MQTNTLLGLFGARKRNSKFQSFLVTQNLCFYICCNTLLYLFISLFILDFDKMSSKDSAAGKEKKKQTSAGSSNFKRHKHGSDKNSVTSSTPVNFLHIAGRVASSSKDVRQSSKSRGIRIGSRICSRSRSLSAGGSLDHSQSRSSPSRFSSIRTPNLKDVYLEPLYNKSSNSCNIFDADDWSNKYYLKDIARM